MCFNYSSKESIIFGQYCLRAENRKSLDVSWSSNTILVSGIDVVDYRLQKYEIKEKYSTKAGRMV